MTFTDRLPQRPRTRAAVEPGSVVEATDVDGRAPSARLRTAARTELPLYRLHLMRVGYLVLGVGLAVTKWPAVIGHAGSLPLMDGVVACLLTGMSLLALLGLRYPVRLLPILLFESVWKLIWLSVVAAPTWAAGDLDPATREVTSACLWVVVILAVIPWRYVWQHYVTAPGERWR
jgi:hypothetical protein